MREKIAQESMKVTKILTNHNPSEMNTKVLHDNNYLLLFDFIMF